MRDETLLQSLSAGLEAHGLMLRGGFHFEGEEAPPAGPGGEPARTLLLVGHAGDRYWAHFAAWRQAHPALQDPLDHWSAEVIGRLAATQDARAVFPSDRPWLPFQRWAMRAERLQPSPLGILMHPEFGLWHAYRGALLFCRRLELPRAREGEHACDHCIDKPCLHRCPVNAYTPHGFAAGACRDHLARAGAGTCRQSGCLARNACPVGASYRLTGEAQAFHLSAFAIGG